MAASLFNKLTLLLRPTSPAQVSCLFNTACACIISRAQVFILFTKHVDPIHLSRLSFHFVIIPQASTLSRVNADSLKSLQHKPLQASTTRSKSTKPISVQPSLRMRTLEALRVLQMPRPLKLSLAFPLRARLRPSRLRPLTLTVLQVLPHRAQLLLLLPTPRLERGPRQPMPRAQQLLQRLMPLPRRERITRERVL